MMPTSKLLRQLLDPRFDGFRLDIPQEAAAFGIVNSRKIREWNAVSEPMTDRRTRRKAKKARSQRG